MTGSPAIPAPLRSDAGRAFPGGLPPPDRFSGRMSVAAAVCDGPGPIDARGRPRVSSCMAALEAEGAARHEDRRNPAVRVGP
ncbi:MAG: hypothetical protein OXE85_05935 [Roseovarius sp.]|nr:hypothetical protein [Roseovarius sp.]